MPMEYYKKIIIPTRPHPDTIIAIFLLKKFGGEKYPSIERAEIEILQDLAVGETPESLANKGILVLDLAGGKFDHHQKNKTLSRLIAEDLGIAGDASLDKLLAYGERDDKFGLGTISRDQIDKALGLSGLIASLNKTYPNDHKRILDTVFPLLEAHYCEENKRNKELPKEFEKKIQEGKAEIFEIKQNKKDLKIIILESDNISMPGWLRSVQGIKADVVVQRTSPGYVNILTRPLKKVDLRQLAANLRSEEAMIRNRDFEVLLPELMKPGRFPEVPEWYYDQATNSILNGGTNPKNISPTAISLKRVREIVKESLG